MAYSYAEHIDLRDRVQTLLNTLVRLARENGFTPNSGEFLIGAFNPAMKLCIEHTNPFPRSRRVLMYFFTVHFHFGPATMQLISIQFDGKTGLVHDSAKFDGAGHYQGSGHIQYHTAGYQPASEFVDGITALLASATGWHKEPIAA